MSAGKISIAAISFLVAIIGGWCLSNYLVPMLLGLHDASQTWDLWWRYYQAAELPAFVPYAFKIKASGVVGFSLPLACWIGLLTVIFKAKQESLHGDASFSTLADLKKNGMLTQTPQSILLGKYKGRYLWLNGALHALVVAPTRSGKTTSIAIPVLLTYMHSVVVLDLKGELFKASSGFREELGQRVWVWAPYDEVGNTLRFNLMTLLANLNPAKRIGEIQTIAAILYPDEQSKDPFWTTQSRAAFTAFASYMFEAWEEAGKAHPNESPIFPSFERILRFSSGDGASSTKNMLQTVLHATQSFISPQTRTAFSNLAGQADQTFSSIIATMQAPLQQFLSPILADATNATDFDITTLRKRPTSLYVNIPTNKLDESSKLLNIFFSCVIGNNLTKQLGEEPDLKYQMLMLMDEFTAMGRVDVWSKRISISASYGVRDICIVQSRSQLRSVYGDQDAQSFITNHGAQVAFPPREQSDANEYSEMLGYKTVRRKQQSRSSGGGSAQVSTSFTEERRALMLPQEIKELPANRQLVFLESCKPTLCDKNWFFRDKLLKKRSSMPPAKIKVVTRNKPGASALNIAQSQNEQEAKWLQ